MEKRGQMKISFGMIFSIILIVIFIGFAIYAIQKFVGLQENVKTEQFIENLQSDVDTAWKSSQTSKEVEYTVPKDVNNICFRDESNNLLLEFNEIPTTRNIEHIDISKTIGTNERLCFSPSDGKVQLTIEKNFGDILVTIKPAQ